MVVAEGFPEEVTFKGGVRGDGWDPRGRTSKLSAKCTGERLSPTARPQTPRSPVLVPRTAPVSMATGGRRSPRSDPFKEAQRRFLAAGKGLGPAAKRQRRPSTAAPAGRKRGRKRGGGAGGALDGSRRWQPPPPAAPRPPRPQPLPGRPPGRWGARAWGTRASARSLPPPGLARRPFSRSPATLPVHVAGSPRAFSGLSRRLLAGSARLGSEFVPQPREEPAGRQWQCPSGAGDGEGLAGPGR